MKLKNLAIYIISATVVLGILFVIISNVLSGEKYTKTNFALNTYTSITAYGSNAEQAAISASDEVSRIEAKMSAHLESSELFALNSAPSNTPVTVSDELFEIIDSALEFSLLTNGLFDITVKPLTDAWSISSNPRVPSDDEIISVLDVVGYENIILDPDKKTVTFTKEGTKLDLGAIAKGYAADKAVEKLTSFGCTKALVDLGGNICIIGDNLKPSDVWLNDYFAQNIKKPWRVGIQTPFAPSGSYCITLVVYPSSPISIVTSGAYERNFTENGFFYHHIINPRTGYPHNGEADSVTIIGESSMVADALSTSAYMMDIPSALSFVKNFGYDCIIIDKNKKVFTTLEKECVIINDDQYSFAN